MTLADLTSVGVEDSVQTQAGVSPVQHGPLHTDQAGALTGRPLLYLTSLSVRHLGEERRAVAVRFYPVNHAGVQTVGHAVGESGALKRSLQQTPKGVSLNLYQKKGQLKVDKAVTRN